MDEARTKVLEAEFETARRQRDELNVVIEYLAKLLGRSPAEAADQKPDESSQSGPANPTADPVSMIGEGEFFGKSSTDAAAAVLERVGRTRPLKTQVLYGAISKGGITMSNDGALYRSLFRSPRFTKVGKSLWGLSEWYPAGATKSAKTQDEGDSPAPSETPDGETASGQGQVHLEEVAS